MSIDLLPSLVALNGQPVLTVVAPTGRAADQGELELVWKHLCTDARVAVETGFDTETADRLMARLERALLDAHDALIPGIVYVATPSTHRVVSLQRAPEPLWLLGERPALTALARAAVDPPFVLLDLDLHDTRLMVGAAGVLHALEAPALPRRIEDVIPPAEHGQHLSWHGGGHPGSYGVVGVMHGEDDAGNERRREVMTFCRRVDDALWSSLPADDTRPMVVAGVADLVAHLHQVGRHPERFTAVLEGSQKHVPGTDLYNRAVDAIRFARERQVAALVDRFRSRHGLGWAGTDESELLAKAQSGLIDTLFVPETRPVAVADDRTTDELIGETLAHRGRIVVVPVGLLDVPAATYRG